MAAATGMAIAGGAAIFQGVSGAIQAGKARKALNAFDRQELSNVYENIGISTAGSDLMREENARVSAMAIDGARSAGIRGIMSTLPKIQAQTNLQNREARQYLDNQIIERDYAIAGDNQRIQSMQEQRDNADLAGLGQQMAVGQQNMWSGIRGVANAGMSYSNMKAFENQGSTAIGNFSGFDSKGNDLIPTSTGFEPGSIPVPQTIGF